MTNVFPYVSKNLEIVPQESLAFPYLDYGYLYGYGLFESVRVEAGVPLLIRDHVTRMRRGSIILDIPFPYSQDEICENIIQLIKKNQVEQGILNLYLTPGDRPSDPTNLSTSTPFLLTILRPWPGYDLAQTVSLEIRQSSFQRTPLDRLKTLSWMKNVLEKNLTKTADDVLLYDHSGALLEASSANVFLVKGKTLVTPKGPEVLQGITRQFLLHHQQELGYEVVLEPVLLDQLTDFDELFLTNALKGVILVSSVDGDETLSSREVSRQVQLRYQQLMTRFSQEQVLLDVS